jgi:nitronate monooxygenase
VIRTWLTDRFDLTVPVVAAPMAGVADGRFAAAVSAAGALGTIGFAGGDTDALARDVATARASGRRFGVGLLAWALPAHPHVVDAVIEARPDLVSVSFGDVAPYVERFRAAGLTVATQAGTLRDALAARDAGGDLVVARGGEGGGHGRDLVATLPLLQAVLDAVDVPVLAAGGIATARGLAAVLAAGAAGAWVGSAFRGCDEGAQPDAAKDAVVAAEETDTIYTTVLDVGRGSAWPTEFGGRALRNRYSERWHGREAELAEVRERSDELPVWTGQAAGLVRGRRSVADVVAELAGAERLLADVARRLRSDHDPATGAG